MAKSLKVLWGWLAELDSTLRLRSSELPVLRRKRLTSTSYERSKLFAKISAGKISLFRNLPVPVLTSTGGADQLTRTLVQGLKTRFPRNETARIQIGPTRTRRRMKVRELIERWEQEKAVLSVTDLHFRKTRFEELIDTSELSDFNILCNDPEFGDEFIDKLEMMTLVISAKGNVTDSHTDDCDGTNHCFTGRKLWLAWDMREGRKRGLQDCTRDLVEDQAAFDMRRFLSLPTAKWFVIKRGETLFLPGNFAHKVITLEPYIGAGSFNVTLPGALGTLSRWHLHGSTDVHRNKLLGKITSATIRRVQALRTTSRKTREEWGLPHLRRVVAQWQRRENNKAKELLLSDAKFASFIEVALKS